MAIGSPNSLKYLGVNAPHPPNLITGNRKPKSNDINHRIGDIWINIEASTMHPPQPVTGSDIYILVSKYENVASWVSIAASASTYITGDISGPVYPDNHNNINIIGGDNITTTGDNNTSSMTIDLNDRIEWPDTDTGAGVGYISLGGHIFLKSDPTGTDVGLGSAVLFNDGGGNNIAIGDGALHDLTTGITNIAIGSSAGIQYTGAESSNILIGNEGVTGESNTIRIGVDGSSAGEQDQLIIAGSYGKPALFNPRPMVQGDNGQVGTATVSAFQATGIGTVNDVTGDGTEYTPLFPVVIKNLGGDFNASLGQYTAPIDGYYSISAQVALIKDTSGYAGALASLVIGSKNYIMPAGKMIDDDGFSFSKVMYLNQGDVLSVVVKAVGGTKNADLAYTDQTNQATWFSGILLFSI